jgi:hypothetical protein
MLSEQTIIGSIDISNNKTISIAKDTLIYKDNIQVAKTRHRCSFMPGEIAAVKEYTGLADDSPEIVYLNAIWAEE